MAGPTERGAALLVVLLFAAILAITLYEEMPSAVFEARRAKEQLLIDRGHQYARAIQLYYRKFRPRYPPSIEALEDTNRMRFLRHRFADPFTGKDDWRIIHTNGIALTDSKVNPLKTAKPNGTNASSGSGWFTNSTSAFGAPSTPSDQATSQSAGEQPELIVPPVRKRGPAVPAAEFPGAAANANSLDASQNDGDLNALLQTELASDGASASPAQPGTQPSGSKAQPPSSNPNPMQMVRNMLSNESPLAPQQTSSGTGALHSGGIAGVASKAGGQSIKSVDDQTDYSLWEFVYDPTKDSTGTSAIAAPAQTAQPSASAPAANSPFGNSGFGASGSESSSTQGNGTRIVNPQ